MARRMRAICTVYDLDPKAVMEGVALLSGADFAFKIADASPPKFRTAEMAKLGALCKEQGIGLVAVDPLVETHDSSGVDEQAMKAVMAAYRQFARDYGVAVLLAHHTPKGAPAALRTPSAARRRSSTAPAWKALTLFEATAEDGLRLPPAACEAPELSAPGRAKGQQFRTRREANMVPPAVCGAAFGR